MPLHVTSLVAISREPTHQAEKKLSRTNHVVQLEYIEGKAGSPISNLTDKHPLLLTIEVKVQERFPSLKYRYIHLDESSEIKGGN